MSDMNPRQRLGLVEFLSRRRREPPRRFPLLPRLAASVREAPPAELAAKPVEAAPAAPVLVDSRRRLAGGEKPWFMRWDEPVHEPPGVLQYDALAAFDAEHRRLQGIKR